MDCHTYLSKKWMMVRLSLVGTPMPRLEISSDAVFDKSKRNFWQFPLNCCLWLENLHVDSYTFSYKLGMNYILF